MSGIGGTCATSLPVELLNFEGHFSEDKIGLQWTTVSEINNDHFELERSSDGKEFSVIAVIGGHGNSSQVNNYKFDDYEIKSGATYYYRLRQVDYDRSDNYSDAIAVQTEFKNSQLVIYLSGENFNIKYDLMHAAEVKVEILNVLGEVVSDLQNGNQNSGEHNLVYKASRPGIYFIQANMNGNTLTKKLIFNK